MEIEIEPKHPPRPNKPKKPPFLIATVGCCKRCGRLVKVEQMHKSKMYDGYICNDSERCLKEKIK